MAKSKTSSPEFMAGYPRLDGKNEPLIIIYAGEYYDLSLFYDVHPGGAKSIEIRKMKDVTKAFHTNPHPHSRYAYDWLQSFKVTDPETLAKLPKIDDDGIDWSKGLLFRVHKLKNYNEWIDKTVHRPLRLFDSEFMEKLTVCKWYVVPTVWLPVVAWTFMKCLENIPLKISIGLWIFGVFFWSFLEYTLHKFIFHIKVYPDSGAIKKTFQFAIHGQHHKNPFDPGRLVFPPVPAAILTAIIYSILRLIVPLEPSYGLLSGGLFGYICYDMIHYYQHHGHPKKGSFMWKLRQHHNRHHFEDFHVGLGISNTFWDDLFDTNFGEEFVKFYNGRSSEGKVIDFDTGKRYALRQRNIVQ